MIQRLRIWHRRAALAATLTLPTMLALGLSARKPWPDSAQVFASSRFLESTRAGVRLWEETASPTTVHAVDQATRSYGLSQAEALLAKIPDPLLYWSPVAVAPGSRLPNEAIFVAALRSPFVWSRPESATAGDSPGHLLVYSLALQEVRAVSRPFSWSELNTPHP